MPIKYKIDVLAALKAAGYSTYKLRKEKILAESTLQQFRNGDIVSNENLSRVCELLRCQPGDILAYVPEGAAEAPPAPEVAEIVPELSEEIPTAPARSEDISVLDLSVRTFNIVCRAGVHTVAELETWVHSDRCCLNPERSPGYKEILEALETYKENTRK